MTELETKRPRLRLKKWFPWAAAAVLLLAAILLAQSVLSSRGRQRELEAELQLQRETIEAMRAEADSRREKEDGLIHQAEPAITGSLVSDRLSALRELVTTEYIYTNSGKYENQNQITIIGQNINIPDT